jgi:hypothetical protein
VPKWLGYSALTVICWGVWGAVSKVVLGMMSPLLNQVLFTLGLVPLVLAATMARSTSLGGNR